MLRLGIQMNNRLGRRWIRCQSSNMVGASNCGAAALYEDGAAYWFRANDDTVMKTAGWISAYVAQLRGFDPPNLGAVGPT